MIDLLVSNDIHLFCLPPHTTNILQPLDVAIFKPLKTYFSKLTDIVNLASLGESSPVTICKKNFTAIFKEACEEKLNIGLIKTGFRKCGIVPFNPEAIDKKRFMPSRLQIPPSHSLDGDESSRNQNPVDFALSSNDTNQTIARLGESVDDIGTPESQSNIDVDHSTPVVPHPTLPGGASVNENHSTPIQRKRVNPLLSVIPASLVDSLIIPKTP